MTNDSATLAPSTVSPNEASELVSAGRARLLDVREPDEYRQERIRGAQLMPLSLLAGGEVSRESDCTVITICRTGRRSAEAALRLRAAGHVNVATLAGGVEAWKRAGLPFVRGTKAPFPVMRQVQVVVGVLLLASVALIAFVSPWFAIVPLFLGGGLTFAGLSGWCGMAYALSAMPWNRATSPKC